MAMIGAKGTQGNRVVLIGRPNVGKSTLFNRVSGARSAIVTPIAGTTRDILRQPVEWLGRDFELVDTGGLFGASSDPLQEEVAKNGLREIETAAVLVVLVDGQDGLMPADEEVVTHARRVGVPMVLAVNKVDNPELKDRSAEFFQLSISPVVTVAAEHGLGVGDLLDEIVARLPGRRRVESKGQTRDSDDIGEIAEGGGEIRLAIVGRPNVGKSSLVNRLVREERVLVSELAGTTRDAIDTVVGWHGRRIRLVDTAGIRKPGKVAQSGQVESVSTLLARRALKRADVAIVLIDATAGVTKQDAAVAGEAERAGCGIIIAVNKWDLVKKEGPDYVKTFDADLRDNLKFADFAPILHISALTGERTHQVFGRSLKVIEARARHVSTAELNRMVSKATARHQPHSRGRKEVKILYATQVSSRPPTFVFFTNIETKFHFSYQRFLRNQLRRAFGFEGSPIWLKARARRVQPRRGRRL
jgi:GTP-binding protein